MSTTVLILLLVVPALIVGSFLNTVIVRVPAKEALFHPGSRCPLCEAPIAWRDQIPVFSWVLLHQKCRSCRGSIPVGYPLVELANVVLWALAALRFGASWELVPFLGFFSVLLALSVIDLELYILPNRITYPSILVSLVASPVFAYLATDNPVSVTKSSYAAGLGYAGFLAFMVIFYELLLRREGMGMGDIKLAVILGIWVGWIHVLLVIYALLFACVLGVVIGVGVLIVRRENKPFPFGPWLAIGAIAAILLSQPILESLNRG
ncbi:MAG: prepilin peptidase [Aquihabitans sp.]